MTEKYSPNMTSEETTRLLAEEEVGVLCLADGSEPYAVPVSYALLDGKIVIHGALTGRKLDVLRKNHQVVLVVYRSPDGMAPHAQGECNYRFESVLVYGEGRTVDDPAARLDLLRRFKRHFDARLGRPPEHNPVTEDAAGKCSCIEIRIDRTTGRRKPAS